MYIADLHIHSRYSRATSRDCTPEYLDLWARRKGIGLIGTGDFTHPAWREELKEKLERAEDGLYVLKDEYCLQEENTGAALKKLKPRFVISGEISSIYKKNGRVRKVHSLILLPGLEAAEQISAKLESIGNIHSDGRPILGLDCRDLLEILLELCPQSIYVPAHIWTPHFSLFGAFSGFDTVKECYEDLSPYIRAMETGLSSDPPMIWRVSALDGYQLISNSDAHSPGKLGREANLLSGELSYEGLRKAILEGEGLLGTLEFFPEEGKYHFDGHRKCHLCLSPREAERYNGKCPVCGKKLTIGVYHRIEQLADRPEGFLRSDGRAFESLMPLPEVIAASTGHSAASRRVQQTYLDVLKKLGPEFEILRNIPLEDIKLAGGTLLAEGIRRLRAGQVERLPGFDGEYGTIKLFQPSELENPDGQMDFFQMLGIPESSGKDVEKDKRESLQESSEKDVEKDRQECLPESRKTRLAADKEAAALKTSEPETGRAALNAQQLCAVQASERVMAVTAGPGTGKTRTLVEHLCYLLEVRKVKASEITAVTFTNRAAGEMRERVQKAMGKRSLRNLKIGTFHSLCLEILKEQGMEFQLADDAERLEAAKYACEKCGVKDTPATFLQKVSRIKTEPLAAEAIKGEKEALLESAKEEQAFGFYQQYLKEQGFLEFDDLLLEVWKLFQEGKSPAAYPYLLVDEFQDINPLQYELLKYWNQNGRELFVIGDADQSIYGFRGSDSGCFSRLKADFPDLFTVELTENYRSAGNIVNGAKALISHNPGEERTLHANQEAGRQIRVVKAKGSLSEGIFAAKEINRLIGGIDMLDAQQKSEEGEQGKNRSFSDIAILYRTHRQGRMMEKCLQKEGIPYVVAGREEFLEDPAVRGTICFFRGLEAGEGQKNKTKENRETGQKAGQEAGQLAGRKAGQEMEKRAAALKRNCLRLLWKECVQESPFCGKAEEQYEALVQKYRPLVRKKKPEKILEEWMKDLNLAEQESMQKLSAMAPFYENMSKFLDGLLLGVESDLLRRGGKGQPDAENRGGKKSRERYAQDAVTLMTLHGSKGLEFPVVMICGVNQGILPLQWGQEAICQEEERRLFYVGMTRAKEELLLVVSEEASEFLEELPKETLIWEEAGAKRETKREQGKQMSLFDLLEAEKEQVRKR